MSKEELLRRGSVGRTVETAGGVVRIPYERAWANVSYFGEPDFIQFWRDPAERWLWGHDDKGRVLLWEGDYHHVLLRKSVAELRELYPGLETEQIVFPGDREGIDGSTFPAFDLFRALLLRYIPADADCPVDLAARTETEIREEVGRRERVVAMIEGHHG